MGIVSCRHVRLAVTIAVFTLPGASSVYGDAKVDIRSHREQVEITGRLAVTTVSQTYVNYTDGNQEVVVSFVLPPGSAVHELAMWVEGLRSPAVLHPRVAARRIYREIREADRDPAILEYLGAGRWQLSVFPILPRKTQKVEFKFTSVLGLRGGRYIYTGAKVAGGTVREALDFEFVSEARCPGGIKDVHALSDRLGVQRRKDRIELGFRAESRPLNEPVTFALTPKSDTSKLVAFNAGGGQRYFAAALGAPNVPAPEKPAGRNVVIVLDASASMKGRRFEIAARAITTIRHSLLRRDKFSVIVAGSDVSMLEDKLMPATRDNNTRVIEWLGTIRPKGATDLAAALRAVEALNKEPSKILDVFFISDGDDSVGDRGTKEDANLFAPKHKKSGGPPPNLRFFAIHVDVLSTVLDYLANTSGGGERSYRRRGTGKCHTHGPAPG